MARILLLIVIAFIVFLLLKGFYRRITKDDDSALPPSTTHKGEDMVACARCGVNLPRSDAHEQGGRLVCHNNPHCRS